MLANHAQKVASFLVVISDKFPDKLCHSRWINLLTVSRKIMYYYQWENKRKKLSFAGIAKYPPFIFIFYPQCIENVISQPNKRLI